MVLGAGATRGASFVGKIGNLSSPLCVPPLNADFFTQLQRVVSTKHQGLVNDVLKDAHSIYGSNYQVTLEEYFSQIESLLQIADLATVKSVAFSKDRLEKMRGRLLTALSAVLEESADVTKKTSAAYKNPCDYHRDIVLSLAPRDTIVTFNYDCVIDDALRRNAKGKWSAKYGYCFPNPDRVRAHEPWEAEAAPHKTNKTINLLKLHGSLNWRPLPTDSASEIVLRERPYKQKGDKQFEMVPPENRKHIEDRLVLKSLWGSAERAIRSAQVLAFIGFSFTPTDLHVNSLFRMALGRNRRLENIVIVNPNADHRRAIRAVCRYQLDRKVRLTQFDSLAEFAPHAARVLAAR